jgi:hypothetical protein
MNAAAAETYNGPDLGDVPYQPPMWKGPPRSEHSPLEVFAVEPQQRALPHGEHRHHLRCVHLTPPHDVIAVDGIPIAPSTVDM